MVKTKTLKNNSINFITLKKIANGDIKLQLYKNTDSRGTVSLFLQKKTRLYRYRGKNFDLPMTKFIPVGKEYNKEEFQGIIRLYITSYMHAIYTELYFKQNIINRILTQTPERAREYNATLDKIRRNPDLKGLQKITNKLYEVYKTHKPSYRKGLTNAQQVGFAKLIQRFNRKELSVSFGYEVIKKKRMNVLMKFNVQASFLGKRIALYETTVTIRYRLYDKEYPLPDDHDIKHYILAEYTKASKHIRNDLTKSKKERLRKSVKGSIEMLQLFKDTKVDINPILFNAIYREFKIKEKEMLKQWHA